MNHHSSEKYISRGEHVAARMLGGEMMIMTLADSMLFSLNEAATAIWRAADGATGLREIVERTILARYDVTANIAYRDAIELVEALAEHGILKITDKPEG